MADRFDHLTLPPEYDVWAPDGSEIRELAASERASMVHCTLGPNRVSMAVAHRTVEEFWYCLEGNGKLWRRLGERETGTNPQRNQCCFRLSLVHPLQAVGVSGGAEPLGE